MRFKLSDDSIYCLEMKHVMFYSRCDDPQMIRTYKKWTIFIEFEIEETVHSKVGVSTSIGYISSVDITRKNLEKFKRMWINCSLEHWQSYCAYNPEPCQDSG